MTTPSNLYAEKIFAEHPTAFWAMDGEADYYSLISEENRVIASTWTASGAAAQTLDVDVNQPFSGSALSLLELSSAPGSGGTYTFTSPNLFNLNTLDSSFITVSCGLHYLIEDDNISKVEIGFIYNSTEHVAEATVPVKSEWQFISKTISFVTTTSYNVQMFIRVTYTSHASQTAGININGIGVGVWSEEFLKTSLGQTSEQIEIDLGNDASMTIDGVPAISYGDTQKTGYYVVSKNTLRARNNSIPMVYGAENSTSLIKNIDGFLVKPSIIIPGQGFMHSIGRNQEQTLEFWLRKTGQEQKIVGSLTTDNGLYSSGGSLVLRIGNKTQSYFVGEWSRPMLVHILSQTNNYTVLVNGEKALSLDIDSKSLTLLDTQPDWLAFYGSSERTEIDNVAIYPYIVSDIVAKRRFVYGQGVEYPLSLNSTYNGKSVFIDYRFAEYSKNYSYPNVGRWNQGIYDNIVPSDNALTLPEYSLPSFASKPGSQHTAQEWLDYHADGNVLSGFFELTPPGLDGSGDEDSTVIHINFPKLSSIIQEKVSSISGVFDINSGTGQVRTLFRVVNRSNPISLSVLLDTENDLYCKVYNGAAEVDSIKVIDTPTEPFLIGIDIDKICQHSPVLLSLFGNHDDVSVYVGAKEDFSLPAGDVSIHSFGFSTRANTQKNFLSTSNGIISISTASELPDGTNPVENNYASYRLSPIKLSTSVVDFNTTVPDVQVTSYWEDYIPLSVLAKEVFTDSGNTQKILDLDFLQINLDSAGIEKAWASFQYLSEGANRVQSTFTGTPPAVFEVVLPDTFDWENTRFQVKDDYVVYVPTEESGSGPTVDLNDLALVIHIEFKNVGVTYNPDIKIKSLQVSSQALNHNSENSINTLFSEKIYPIVSGGTKPYKAQNPFRIYKSSTPYLYLSKNTGIEIVGNGMAGLDLGGGSQRALRIPLSKSTASGNLSSMQMAIRYNYTDISVTTPIKIFELKTSSVDLEFYMERSADQKKTGRARIFAKKAGDSTEYFYGTDGSQLIEYYLNGKKVQNPVITGLEWAMLGITFPNPLTITSSSSIDLTGSLLFNNISYYQVDPLKLNEQTTYNTWNDVDDLTWGDVDDQSWQQNLVSSEVAITAIDPSTVYSVYLGTNKIIVDTTDNDAGSTTLRTDSYEYRIYKNVSWQSQTILPT